jgi:hypothetical protein
MKKKIIKIAYDTVLKLENGKLRFVLISETQC